MIVSFLYPFNLRGVDAPYLWVYYHQLAKFLPDEITFIGDESYLYELEYFRKNKRWEISNEFVTQKNFFAQNDFSYLCLDKTKLMGIYNKYEDDLVFFKEYLTSDIPELADIIKAAIKKLLQTTTVDAVISWSNCPSLQEVCNEYSIPVIYNEVGPLRSPVFLYSSFFDFNGVNGNTSVGNRFAKFISAFDSGNIELSSIETLKKNIC